MWRPLIAQLAVLFLCLPLYAKTHSDWTKVETLKFDAPVRIELQSGEEFSGRFHSADGRCLRVKVRDAQQYGATVRREFRRDEVRVLELLGDGRVDPYAYVHHGQIVGGVAGAVAVGVASGRAWPIGVLAGAAGGAILGTVVGGAAGLVADTNHRRRKIIYQAPTPPMASAKPVPVF